MRLSHWSVFALIGVVSIATGSALADAARPSGNRVPIVIELFTSQGCSSCPPVDALLRDLDEQPIEGARLIVLSQHVDYWNSLGWKDPFSSREASIRQRRYGELLAGGRVYTPQMVVNGAVEFVGNRRQRAYEVIAAQTPRSRGPIPIRVEVGWSKETAASLAIALPDLSDVSEPFDVLLAITESDLASDVSRGENAGRTLSHAGVVRRLVSIGAVDSSATTFERNHRVALSKKWDRTQLRVVVLLQEPDQGRILEAVTVPLVAGRGTTGH